jgi:hypothetical protein
MSDDMTESLKRISREDGVVLELRDWINSELEVTMTFDEVKELVKRINEGEFLSQRKTTRL